MFLVKLCNWIIFILIIAASYNLFFGVESKIIFSQLQLENNLLIEKNSVLTEQNNILEVGIQSSQKNDAHAEHFAREELNLIFKGEEFLSFQKKVNNESEP